MIKANYAPLTPLSLLWRAVDAHPERVAIVHGEERLSYRALGDRVRRLAGALRTLGVAPGDVVAVLAPNVPAHVEAHFGVPLAGAILNSINIRLDPAGIAQILVHGGARVLLADRELTGLARSAIDRLDHPPILVELGELAAGPDPTRPFDYEALLAAEPSNVALHAVEDERSAISLNYTSGTTGRPKGVVYDHRGTYLNAVGNVVAWSMAAHPVYLWTLPMFHCNGWCFPWTITALAGTHVCLRRPDPAAMLDAIRAYDVTHMCGAPVVIASLVDAAREADAPPMQVRVMVAGAPPPASVMSEAAERGLALTHTYGLTETYGPCVICDEQAEWTRLSDGERAKLMSRQGVRYALQEDVEVVDIGTGIPVPADGETLGEVVMRGNCVMREYLHDSEGTAEAFAGGWFHSGDLAVKHPDNYIEIRDRAKDIIISGGENVSSIEVENVLHQHPSVSGAAVVAKPDARWGETPCAFVALRPGAELDEAEARAFCRARLAGFKVPGSFVFGELPRTATGKVRKDELRERANRLVR